MLSNNNINVVLAVKDMGVAKSFYGGTLGLEQVDEGPAGVLYRSGSCQMLVYESEFAGTNKATAASWVSDDIESDVNELKAKGVTFEHYDMEGVTQEGDIHMMGPMKAVWFKDPDGNILNVTSGGM
jgi:catechol-2,3-dioxygenase